jgi:hypothetical protein
MMKARYDEEDYEALRKEILVHSKNPDDFKVE